MNACVFLILTLVPAQQCPPTTHPGWQGVKNVANNRYGRVETGQDGAVEQIVFDEPITSYKRVPAKTKMGSFTAPVINGVAPQVEELINTATGKVAYRRFVYDMKLPWKGYGETRNLIIYNNVPGHTTTVRSQTRKESVVPSSGVRPSPFKIPDDVSPTPAQPSTEGSTDDKLDEILRRLDDIERRLSDLERKSR